LRTSSTRVARFTDLVNERPATIVDARDPTDHATGMIRGAIAAHVSRLGKRSLDVEGEVWVHCQSGYRAAVAVGFLERSGGSVTAIMDNLTPEIIAELSRLNGD
jgi:rhodanese-related sulfurtransferase